MPYMELFRGEGRKTWQLRITDHRGIRRQVSTRCESRSTALSISNKIERLIDYRIRQDPTPQDLLDWIGAVHRSIRDKLVDWEIITTGASTSGSPLYNPPRPDPLPPNWTDPPLSLVDLWEEELRGKEVTGDHAEQSAQRVRVLLSLPVADNPPIVHPSDITPAGAIARARELKRIGPPSTKYRTKRKPMSPRTCQYYLDCAAEFCGWLVSKGILATNPLLNAVAYSEPVMRAAKQRDRRALTTDEQVKLITKAPDLPERRGEVSGPERAMIYRLVLRTGLRASEVVSLCARNFNFFTRQITVLAGDGKARREDTIPIAAELLEPLRQHLANKLPDAPAFTTRNPDGYCEMLRDDLADLGIPEKDALGRVVDFHALRHTYGTELAKVVMPAVHQRLMRHQDIRTTMRFYVHMEDADKADGLAKLPAIDVQAQNKSAGGAGGAA